MSARRLYNTHVKCLPGGVWKSDWKPGVSYSEVLLKLRLEYPELGLNDIVVEETNMLWDDWIKETKRDGFQ